MRRMFWLAAALALALFVAACGTTDKKSGTDTSGGSAGTTAPAKSKTGSNNAEFFDQATMDKQLAQRTAQPQGPADKPWLQAIDPQMVSTDQYKKSGGGTVCFSNAATDNPWRQVGWKTMQAEVKLHDNIKTFRHVDAGAKDDKQISDVEDFSTGGKCDVLIVSPNTTKTLTPAVEAACKKVPVVVFDRGVTTDCPVTFVHPIGGYAYGATGAEFLTKQLKPGAKVLALRILPGVDVLETRWSGAKKIFDASKLDVVGVEFSNGDPAKAKSIVSDYLQREGHLDAVWMDAGATSAPAMEAFEDAGQDIPPFVGEDQQDFLKKWKDTDTKAIAPTYPTFQWRTAIIAASDILAGKQVPKEWVLPQPTITQDNLDKYIQGNMPPLHYAMCGCENMPGYPQYWGGK
jgi:ribose transport system substrate-binding protein